MENKEKNDFRLHDDDMMTFTILVLLTSTNIFFCSTTFSPLNDYLGVLYITPALLRLPPILACICFYC